MSRDPELPVFENVRLATLDDVPRIASVAAAGFFWSPTFQFQRPYHANFAEDTISSYSWSSPEQMWYGTLAQWSCSNYLIRAGFAYREEILNPASIVLVAEDLLNPHEDEKVYDALRECPLYSPGRIPQVKVIVGVCSIDLRPNSPFIGVLDKGRAWAQMQSPEVPTNISTLGRDRCSKAARVYNEATSAAKKRHLGGLMRISTLAVHPAYWRRGHANRLVSWCTSLADAEAAPIGISAAPMGAPIAAQAGFEEREVVSFRGEAPCSESRALEVRLWIGVRPPLGSPSETSTICSESSLPDTQTFEEWQQS